MPVSAEIVGVLTAAFFATELIASPIFGLLSDRLGSPPRDAVRANFRRCRGDPDGSHYKPALDRRYARARGSRPLRRAFRASWVSSRWRRPTTRRCAVERRRASRLATLGGIGAGTLAAGILYDGIPGVWAGLGALAFFLNAGIYGISFLIYRYGVHAPDQHVADPRDILSTACRRYFSLLRESHIWLLAPTWIAVNAAIGVYSGQGLFNLIRIRDPRFVDQLLAAGSAVSR